jgi:hypothetical protein
MLLLASAALLMPPMFLQHSRGPLGRAGLESCYGGRARNEMEGDFDAGHSGPVLPTLSGFGQCCSNVLRKLCSRLRLDVAFASTSPCPSRTPAARTAAELRCVPVCRQGRCGPSRSARNSFPSTIDDGPARPGARGGAWQVKVLRCVLAAFVAAQLAWRRSAPCSRGASEPRRVQEPYAATSLRGSARGQEQGWLETGGAAGGTASGLY